MDKDYVEILENLLWRWVNSYESVDDDYQKDLVQDTLDVIEDEPQGVGNTMTWGDVHGSETKGKE